MNIFKELWRNRKLVWKLGTNDFKTKYAGSYFGILWAFVQPMVTILIYIFIFQFGFRVMDTNNGYPYALWLIAGIIPWFFFSEGVINATNCLLEYSYLVKKVVFKISVLPLVKILSALFVHLFFIAFAFVVYVIMGKMPLVQMVQLLYYMLCAICLVTAISYMTCSIVPFFRDFGTIINIIMQVGMWACPIMWDMTTLKIPDKIVFLLKLNPMFYVVQGYRDSFMDGVWFWERPFEGVYFWVVTLLVAFLGFHVFRKLRVHFSDVL